MAAILGEATKAKRRKMLETLATTGVALGDVYRETLQRIGEQNDGLSELGMRVLMWVSHSRRPLQIAELCHALVVEIGSMELNPDDAPSADSIIDSCLGLVIIDEQSTFRLIHHSLREYIDDNNIFPRVHQTLAETCLTCLNFSQANNLSVGSTPNCQYASFLEYCSVYWGTHARMQPSDLSKELALKLFSHFENSVSPKSPLANDEHWRAEFRAHFPFSALHYACHLGIVELVAYLIGMADCEVNGKDFTGKTSLQWASKNAHEAVVRLLLEVGNVNPDEVDDDGGTALIEACHHGHEGVVRLLLANKNVNPEKADKGGKTPLMIASSCPHEGVVRLLLARDDVDPNRSDNEGKTALYWASFLGYSEVVRLLLETHDVDPNKPDKSGDTPLIEACHAGHEETVRLLLGRHDINPDKLNNDC